MSDLSWVCCFHWLVHMTVVFAAMRVVDLKGWSLFEGIKHDSKVGVVPRILSSSHLFIILPCLLVSVVRTSHPSWLSPPTPQQATKCYQSVYLLSAEDVRPTAVMNQPGFRLTKVLWGPQTTCTSCFLGHNINKGQFIPRPFQILFIFFVYVSTILFVCLTSVWNSKDETKLKKITKHYREEKTVCRWNLTASFKLPVLSCSQLLKITGLKNTIYNVLALDRCSTCVTVLIYETKMVTVNYVFLCAFFFFFFF